MEFLLAEKVAASACIGLLIGLEREWAHKDVGVRSFALATLLGTLAWLLSPTFAVVEVAVVGVIIVLVNVHALWHHQPLEITTSLALAATNVLGVLVGSGLFFLEDRTGDVHQQADGSRDSRWPPDGVYLGGHLSAATTRHH